MSILYTFRMLSQGVLSGVQSKIQVSPSKVTEIAKIEKSVKATYSMHPSTFYRSFAKTRAVPFAATQIGHPFFEFPYKYTTISRDEMRPY